MNYIYIDEIVKQLLSDTFSVFCGAGATADATNSKWEDIFCETTQQFYHNNFSNDIYYLADLEKNYYNDHFYDGIIRALTTKNDKQSAHINAIIDLNINHIWTTNFDEIIERSIYSKHGIKPTVIKESRDLFSSTLNAPYIIYKLNGSIADKASMVLTKSDFFDYFKKQRLLFELLKRQLVLDTFLFVGYSFSDDLVLNALREIKEVFPEKGKQHYRFAIEKSKKDSELRDKFDKYERQYFEDKYNIKTICLQSYAEIDLYLREIYKRFCNHNVFICGSFRDIPYDMRLQIESLIDHLIFRLFANGFNVYSGNGRGLGEIVVARSSKYQGKMPGKLVNRPLIFIGDSDHEKKEKNKLIMKDSNTMIIICGQDDSLRASKNVLDQYQQFKNSNETGVIPLIIPLPTTGYAAKEIYESEDFVTSECFQRNKNIFFELENCLDPLKLSQLVVNLISAYRKEPSV